MIRIDFDSTFASKYHENSHSSRVYYQKSSKLIFHQGFPIKIFVHQGFPIKIFHSSRFTIKIFHSSGFPYQRNDFETPLSESTRNLTKSKDYNQHWLKKTITSIRFFLAFLVKI